jgi:hypothetical protein
MSGVWRLVAFHYWLRSVRTTMLYTLPLVLGAGQVSQGRGAVYVACWTVLPPLLERTNERGDGVLRW